MIIGNSAGKISSEGRDALKEDLKMSYGYITKLNENVISGNLKEAGKQIGICRKKQLERLHESQRCIDCLDYLNYRINEKRG